MRSRGWSLAIVWLGIVVRNSGTAGAASKARDELLLLNGDITTTDDSNLRHRTLSVGASSTHRQGQYPFAAPKRVSGRHGTNVVMFSLFTELPMHQRGRCFVYHGIWKCGNNAVRSSLESASTTIPLMRFDHPPVMHMPSLLQKMCETVFTFATVREPLEHYISGFTEYMWRMFPRDRQVHNKTISDVFESSLQWLADDTTFVDMPPNNNNALEQHHHNNYDALHMLQMTRAVDLQQMDFLVRIEHMDADFNEAMHRARAESFKHVHIDALRGGHPADEKSLNKQRARATLRELLIGDRNRRLKLCALLQKDYQCLGFRAQRCQTYSAENAAWTSGSPDWPPEEMLDSSTWKRPECFTAPLYWGGRQEEQAKVATEQGKAAAVAAGKHSMRGAQRRNSYPRTKELADE